MNNILNAPDGTPAYVIELNALLNAMNAIYEKADADAVRCQDEMLLALLRGHKTDLAESARKAADGFADDDFETALAACAAIETVLKAVRRTYRKAVNAVPNRFPVKLVLFAAEPHPAGLCLLDALGEHDEAQLLFDRFKYALHQAGGAIPIEAENSAVKTASEAPDDADGEKTAEDEEAPGSADDAPAGYDAADNTSDPDGIRESDGDAEDDA